MDIIKSLSSIYLPISVLERICILINVEMSQVISSIVQVCAPVLSRWLRIEWAFSTSIEEKARAA